LLDDGDWNLRERRDPPGRSVCRTARRQFGLGLINTTTTPSDAEARRELQERVRRTLEQLEPRDRDILCMR